MGIVYTTIKIRNPLKDRDFVEVEAKVDTGATLLVIPVQNFLWLRLNKWMNI